MNFAHRLPHSGLVALFLAVATTAGAAEPFWRGVLLEPAGVSEESLAALRTDQVTAVALTLTEDSRATVKDAASRLKSAGLEVHYWFEIGRLPEVARQHPEWLASLQGHQQWRRQLPALRTETDREIVKVEPWVPIRYAEAFRAHTNRVATLLDDLPAPAAVWLNHLQGAPSACGCGHQLCRWTTDYGPKRTAEQLDHTAAAQFVRAVSTLTSGAKVIPVWATECEEADRADFCGGVACYDGRCWRDWSQQLDPLATVAEQIGVLATYKSLGRDLPRYGGTGAWVGEAVRSFQRMPPIRAGQPVPANRLIAVVQGWGVTSGQEQAQVDHAKAAGAHGILIARVPLDESWRPKIVPLARTLE